MAYEYTRESTLFEDVIVLCKPLLEKDENGIVKRTDFERREVFAQVGSLYMKEFYSAYQAGIQNALKFVVNLGDWELGYGEFERGREAVIEYDDRIYTVYRAFMANDSVELYAREDVGTWEGSRA